MRTNLIILFALCVSCPAIQTSARADDGSLSITLAPTTQPVMSGHLKMGGRNPQGIELNVDNRSLTLDAKPILPVMGEFHYARYPHQEWERELLKMKAGGINIVSAYIFWIHHEEVEGQFEWTGDKNLREFVQLCAKHGLNCQLRLGPWDHGEARNGGIPDWVMAKIPARQLRTTDPAFMSYTRILYTQIFNQVKGLLYKDGGPITGIQVENEMRNNAPYMLALKNLAREVGFDVPIYTMTGWGPARVPQDELLPMFGGYGDGFWIGGNSISGASRIQYFFTHNPNDEKTTMESAPGQPPAAMAYLSRYPYLTCEIGGGMAIAYARRPLMSTSDVTSVALCKLGSGSNLMGYYMYHGGGNPPGKLSTLQETQATKYPNDLPVIHYDFQAPLGQFGQERPSYHVLRLMHMFLADFGGDLCTMPSTLPAALSRNLEDTTTLRWVVRSDGHRGFIFINNYERGVSLPEKEAQFTLNMADGAQKIPASPIKIPADSSMFWPFNFDLNGAQLHYATAQPICKIDDGATPCYCFFSPAGIDAEFAFDLKSIASVDAGSASRNDANGIAIFKGFHPGLDCVTTVHAADGQTAKILLLTQEQALHLWKAKLWDKPRLFWSPANLVFDESKLTVLSTDPNEMSVSIYPSPGPSLAMGDKNLTGSPNGLFTRYAAAATARQLKIDVHQVKEAGPARAMHTGSQKKPEMPSDGDFDAAAVWQVSIPKDAIDQSSNVLLRIDYQGDVARAYIGDRMIDDDFYFGQPWEIGLNRFAPEVLEKGLTIKILPLKKDYPLAIQPDKLPVFDAKGEALQLRSIEPVVEYQLTIN
jgi:hypothetical protein